MCMIILPADVSKTKIIAIPNNNHNKQLLIYSNTVDTRNNNVMILPVPIQNVQTIEEIDKNIEFINLADIDDLKNVDLFKKLYYCFNDESFLFSQGRYRSLNTNSKYEYVKYDVGSYIGIKTKDIDSIIEIVNIEFKLNMLDSNFLTILKKYYSVNYAFILFALKEGLHSYYPFAYSHDIVNNKLFIPTRHIHNGQYKTLIPDKFISDDFKINKFDNFEIYSTINNLLTECKNNMYPTNHPNYIENMNKIKEYQNLLDTYSNKLQTYYSNNLEEIYPDWDHIIYYPQNENIKSIHNDEDINEKIINDLNLKIKTTKTTKNDKFNKDNNDNNLAKYIQKFYESAQYDDYELNINNDFIIDSNNLSCVEIKGEHFFNDDLEVILE